MIIEMLGIECELCDECRDPIGTDEDHPAVTAIVAGDATVKHKRLCLMCWQQLLNHYATIWRKGVRRSAVLQYGDIECKCHTCGRPVRFKQPHWCVKPYVK